MRLSPRSAPEAWVYAAVAVACWPFPVVQVLHAESMALLAFAAFFVAGVSALHRLPSAGLGRTMRRELVLLAVPLGLWTVTLGWAPNCGYLLGLLFFVLFPVVTVVLAVSLAWALLGVRRAALWLVVMGLVVTVGGVLYDLGLHPQFYTYNHVFGGVLGPIYDEELAVRPGLFVFRALTLLWAALLASVGTWRHSGRSDLRAVRLAAVCALCIGVVYLNAAALGINTTAASLRAALGGHVRTAHFDVYFDPASLAASDLRRLVRDHEFRYGQMAARLDQDVDGRIQSYLYPDAATKARLTGARTTSVAPVWLTTPQTHVLLDRYEGTFAHELAHVFSRPHGLPLLNASLQAGLVEGWAVALEPPDGLPSPHAQVAAGVTLLGDSLLARRLTASLAPQGFWGGRAAVSYTTVGSFVAWLLAEEGPEKLKAVYARGEFERVYGVPLDTLADRWQTFVAAHPISPMAQAVTAVRFSRPSLFEKTCPHHVPRHVRRTRDAITVLAAGDTTQAVTLLDRVLADRPDYLPALYRRAALHLHAAAPDAAVALLAPAADSLAPVALRVLYGDALALTARPAEARSVWAAALADAPTYARDLRAFAVLRPHLSTDALALWYASGPSADRAARLAALGDPAADVLAAFAYAAAGRPADALAVLPQSDVPLSTDRLLAWRARFAFAAERWHEAARYTIAARRAAMQLGDTDFAALLTDRLAQINWARQNSRMPLPVRSTGSTVRPVR